MASSSSDQNTSASAGPSSSKKSIKSTNEGWSYKDYLTVRVLVDEILEKHGDIEQHHLSAIFAEVCPHEKQYPSGRLYEHKTTSKNKSVAKAKQRAWRKNEFANLNYPGPDYQLWMEIKEAIRNSPTFLAIEAGNGPDTEDCGRLEDGDTRAAGESEDDEDE